MTNQRVRKAAEDAYLTCFEDVPNPAWMAALIAGKHDNDPVVQAFACFEAEALAQGRLEGAKAMQDAVILKLDECCEPCFQCNQNVTALDPAAIVKEPTDAD